MSTSAPNEPSRSFGQLAVFLLLLVLGAIVLFFVMRAVTPVKERYTSPVLPTTTTSPSSSTSTTPSALMPVPSTPSKPTPSMPTSTAGSGGLPAVRPRPANTMCDAQNFICVSTPQLNDLVSNPTMITGTAIAFENTFLWRIEDASGNELAADHATVNAPDVGQAGPFEIRAFWDAEPRTASGTLVVYEASARDGAPIHVVRVPVRFSRRAVASRMLYFVPEEINQNMDCVSVQAKSFSIPGSIAPIEATLRELVAIGPGEVPTGLKTLIPEHAHLVSFSLNNGVAKAIFDLNLESGGGGACRVGAIRAQITKTLLQFPSVQQVIISVEGKTPEETLQP